ncbi:lymphocyte antigen-6, epidermis isoform 2-T2 [Spinachia spinachia]
MNRIILQLVAVGFCFAVVQALQCYECKFGLGDLCATSKVTCASGERCFKGVGEAAGVLKVKMMGCLAVDLCNKTTDTTFPGSSNTTIYKIVKTCCTTDLCNAAPGTSRLSLALATIAALFVANTVV